MTTARYAIRPDGYGRYEVLWPSGTVRLAHLDKDSADVALDYFGRCDAAVGMTAADREATAR